MLGLSTGNRPFRSNYPLLPLSTIITDGSNSRYVSEKINRLAHAIILLFLRFGAAPADAAEADAFISDLYVHLVEEAAVVLNHRIK